MTINWTYRKDRATLKSCVSRLRVKTRRATREEKHDETAERHEDPRQSEIRVCRRVASESPLSVLCQQGRRRRAERRVGDFPLDGGRRDRSRTRTPRLS